MRTREIVFEVEEKWRRFEEMMEDPMVMMEQGGRRYVHGCLKPNLDEDDGKWRAPGRTRLWNGWGCSARIFLAKIGAKRDAILNDFFSSVQFKFLG